MTQHGDVAIVTDLRFPGGNASSTLDELDTLVAAGLRVMAVHCPANISGDKPRSARYDRHAARCLTAADVDRLNVHTLIVRHPGVVCGEAFARLAPRIAAEQIVVVINNSMFRARGEPAYDPWELSRRVRALPPARLCRLFPIGPLVREELVRYMPPPFADWLGPFDWTPTFDIAAFSTTPRPHMAPPFKIGRHGRDSAEKWLEDAAALRLAYPAGEDFQIHILGGADGAERVLRKLPANWTVTPFGGEPPARYLERLDAFVYFPHTGLREAFGRSVVEAVCAGVPCILHESLRPAFGDLAFFCAPGDVAGVVRRLAEDDDSRQRFAANAREIVKDRYASSSLMLRLARLDMLTEEPERVLANQAAHLSQTLQTFRRRVEAGLDRQV